MSKNSGFTLIELMIVVAVIGIIASVAYPAYRNYILEARRADVQGLMLEVQINEERYRGYNNEYATAASLAAAGMTVPTNDYYDVTIGSTGTSTYTITVNAKAGSSQLEDKEGGTNCYPMTLNQSNTKTPADCWAN